MKCKLSLAALVSLGLMANVASADYRFQLDGGHNNVDIDYLDNETNSVSGIYYINSVTTANMPLNEAAFLNKADFAKLNVSRTSLDLEDLDYAIDTDSDVYYIGGGGWFYNDLLYAEIGYQRLETTVKLNLKDYYDDSSYRSTTTDSVTSYKFGIAPIKGLLVYLAGDNEQSLSESIGLGAKYVHQFDTRAINAEVLVRQYEEDGRDEYVTTLAGDFYFTNAFSIGAGVTTYSQDVGDSKFARVNYFFTESVALSLKRTDDEDGWDETYLGLTVRF